MAGSSSGSVSCLSCRFYVGASSPGDAVSVADRAAVAGSPAPSAAVCGKLSAVLALRPDMPADRGESVAAKCESFEPVADGEAGPGGGVPELVAAGEVGAPLLVGAPVSGRPSGGAGPCAGCRFFVPHASLEAAGAADWDDGAAPILPGACASLSAFVPASVMPVAGESCGRFVSSADGGAGEATFSDVDLFAHIRADLDAAGEAVSGAPAASADAGGEGRFGAIKSADDKTGPIKSADEKTGPIKSADEKTGPAPVATFRVFSDDKRRHVDLPVFDPEDFSATERGKIPLAGDDSTPELFDDYANLAYRTAAAWVLGETPALTGAAGLGKSQAAYYLAWKMQVPLERVSITSASQLDDLAGYTELRRSEEGAVTEFVHGRVPQAWAKPCVLLLDEPNTAPPEVWQFLRPLTDAAKQLILDANHGERIERHPHSYLMMAMNPAWDYRNTGVSQLSDADGRRLVHVSVPAPDADRERKIIASHIEASGLSLEDKKLDSLVAIGQELRSLADAEGGAGSLHITWGLAQQVKVARLLAYFDFAEAFRLAGADNVDPQQRELILGVVNRLTSTAASTRRRRARG